MYSKFFIPVSMKYLELSAKGAIIGGGLGTITSAMELMCEIVNESARSSPKDNTLDKICNVTEKIPNIAAKHVGIGLFIGGLPVTYPAYKLFKKGRDLIINQDNKANTGYTPK